MSIPITDEANVVHSYATKEFFIDMLTRDIGVIDAVLELVDNSVDKIIDTFGLDVMDFLISDAPQETSISAFVDIHFTEDFFSIEDNSGGISRSQIQNEVFVFGNPQERLHQSGLSAYGIGMKRAFFKLGRHIAFRSRTASEGESALVWDVDEWKQSKNESWDLQLSEPDAVGISFTHEEAGTLIRIEKLNNSITNLFGQVPFQNELVRRLQTAYALFVRSGITFRVNGNTIGQSLPDLITSDEIPIARNLVQYQDEKSYGDSTIDVLIIAGLTPRDDRKPRGWYIFCNGRMVVESDQTVLTGWGDRLPQFRPKFNHFVGFVYFRCTDVRALPWTTTKQGVEREAPVFQYALDEMSLQARGITSFLDDAYKEDTDTTVIDQAMEKTHSISLFQVGKSNQSFEYKSPKVAGPRKTTISFQRLEEEVQRVKEAAGNSRLSNKALGEMLFDYYVEMEVG